MPFGTSQNGSREMQRLLKSCVATCTQLLSCRAMKRQDAHDMPTNCRANRAPVASRPLDAPLLGRRPHSRPRLYSRRARTRARDCTRARECTRARDRTKTTNSPAGEIRRAPAGSLSDHQSPSHPPFFRFAEPQLSSPGNVVLCDHQCPISRHFTHKTAAGESNRSGPGQFRLPRPAGCRKSDVFSRCADPARSPGEFRGSC